MMLLKQHGLRSKTLLTHGLLLMLSIKYLQNSHLQLLRATSRLVTSIPIILLMLIVMNCILLFHHHLGVWHSMCSQRINQTARCIWMAMYRYKIGVTMCFALMLLQQYGKNLKLPFVVGLQLNLLNLKFLTQLMFQPM